MNSRDRVQTALRGGTPDRLPKTLGFFSQELPHEPNLDLDEYFKLDVRFTQFNSPSGQDDFREYLETLPEDIHVGSRSQVLVYHEWDYHPELGPDGPLSHINSIEDLIEYTFPDLFNPSRYQGLAEQVSAWHSQGLAVAGAPPHLGGELFETATRLRGFENFMKDLIQNKPLVNYLLDQLTTMTIHNALILAKAGIDILLLDDDVSSPTGLMLSPKTWKTFFKPRLKDIIFFAREVHPDLLIFYHSDGNFTEIVGDLIEIGVNVINPIQPDCMNGAEIKREFGKRVALWGTVGTAHLMNHGTTEDIRSEVALRIEILGPDGLLLSPAYDIDFASMENITAFIEAVDEYGVIQ